MEKNRIHSAQMGEMKRKSYSRIKEVLEMPNLLEVQKNSYKWFLDEGLQEVFEDEEIEICDETTAADIEDWDSFEHINLVVAIEEDFSFKIPMGKTITMKNVGEMVDIIIEMGK